MSDPKMQRVMVNVHYPDDPPWEMAYREDGSIEQLSGNPPVAVEMYVAPADAPTMTVRIEHSDGWTELGP